MSVYNALQTPYSMSGLGVDAPAPLPWYRRHQRMGWGGAIVNPYKPQPIANPDTAPMTTTIPATAEALTAATSTGTAATPPTAVTPQPYPPDRLYRRMGGTRRISSHMFPARKRFWMSKHITPRVGWKYGRGINLAEEDGQITGLGAGLLESIFKAPAGISTGITKGLQYITGGAKDAAEAVMPKQKPATNWVTIAVYAALGGAGLYFGYRLLKKSGGKAPGT